MFFHSVVETVAVKQTTLCGLLNIAPVNCQLWYHVGRNVSKEEKAIVWCFAPYMCLTTMSSFKLMQSWDWSCCCSAETFESCFKLVCNNTVVVHHYGTHFWWFLSSPYLHFHQWGTTYSNLPRQYTEMVHREYSHSSYRIWQLCSTKGGFLASKLRSNTRTT